jgi:hypothetical protein
MIRVMKRAPWIALGAAAAWLLDGEHGAARRAELKSTVRSLAGGEPDPIAPAAVVPPTAAR